MTLKKNNETLTRHSFQKPKTKISTLSGERMLALLKVQFVTGIISFILRIILLC